MGSNCGENFEYIYYYYGSGPFDCRKFMKRWKKKLQRPEYRVAMSLSCEEHRCADKDGLLAYTVTCTTGWLSDMEEFISAMDPKSIYFAARGRHSYDMKTFSITFKDLPKTSRRTYHKWTETVTDKIYEGAADKLIEMMETTIYYVRDAIENYLDGRQVKIYFTKDVGSEVCKLLSYMDISVWFPKWIMPNGLYTDIHFLMETAKKLFSLDANGYTFLPRKTNPLPREGAITATAGRFTKPAFRGPEITAEDPDLECLN